MFLMTQTLLAWSAPVLIDVADQARAAGVDLALDADPPTTITPFALPRLPDLGRRPTP
jgi:methionyl-tRNA synthetase